MSSDDALAAMRALTRAVDAVTDSRLDGLTHPELLSVLGDVETITRRLPAVQHVLLARLQREASPVALGAKSFGQVLTGRLRISGKDARRRLADAKELGPRVALNGEPLSPVLPLVARAQADGVIGAEHVEIMRGFFDSLPGWVDQRTREQSEVDLVRIAVRSTPEVLASAGERLSALLDQDGPEPDDTERARKRFISLGRQQADGMTRLTGLLDPQSRATVEAIQAKWGAPGMCNPDDDSPCVTGTPSQAQIDGDTRSCGQRTHDAFTAIGRNALSSGELGQHNGLPVTIIVSTTLQELESGRGSAVTAGGSLLPMSDVIRLASHAHHYLVVFDKHTNEALYLGRTKRCASVAQRVVLLSRDVGCTFPGCPVPGNGCQVHHVNSWAKNNGQTNIDEEVLACPGDNRLAEEGWTVRIRDGQVEWIPPPELDTGQARVNFYHHPKRLLAATEDDGT